MTATIFSSNGAGKPISIRHLATGHTPGPWTADDNGIVRANWAPVAVIPLSTPKDTELANARLIAAAPDMYAALADLLAHLWDGRKRDVKKDYSLMVAEVAARNAIQKAEGG